LQPEKLATPLETVLESPPVQLKVAPDVPVEEVIDKVTTVELSPVTVFPPASWTATTGWVGKFTPPVELDGLVVKASFVAEPEAMTTSDEGFAWAVSFEVFTLKVLAA
jgi:hypothetical protein